jgi:(2Fe-2S) ferredoxin
MIMKPTLKTYPDGHQEWYLNDRLHREDGPAVIWPDGRQ